MRPALPGGSEQHKARSWFAGVRPDVQGKHEAARALTCKLLRVSVGAPSLEQMKNQTC